MTAAVNYAAPLSYIFTSMTQIEEKDCVLER